MKKVLILLACFALIFSIPAFADKEGSSEQMKSKMHEKDQMMGKGMMMHKGMMGKGKMCDMFMDKLDLSEDQKEKIKDLKEELKKKNKDMNEKKRSIWKEIKEEMMKDDPDMRKIEKKLKEKSKLSVKIMLNKFKMKKEIHKVLTKDQRAEMKKMREEKMEKWKEMKEKKEKGKKEGMMKHMMGDDK